jgi:tryptophanyl-tRNA synthetase
MPKKRILTGDRPTGPLHLGHYVGSLANRIRLQHEYDAYIIIADVQALTDNFDDPQKVRDNLAEVAMDYMAVGIDPNIATIFVQSLVPQIAELTVFYSNLVTVARLERNPTTKEEIREKGMEDSVTYGFLGYPVSQAADITIVNADLVPVGVDQAAHVELTRDIVARFNVVYGPTIVEPEALIGEVPKLPGTDGKPKMSKSLNNAIFLKDDPKTVERKVMSMYTDPTRIRATDPGKDEVEEMKRLYRIGGIGDVAVKRSLVKALNDFLDPIRERRADLEARPDDVRDVLLDGTRRTRAVADETIAMVRRAMKIDYFPGSGMHP